MSNPHDVLLRRHSRINPEIDRIIDVPPMVRDETIAQRLAVGSILAELTRAAGERRRTKSYRGHGLVGVAVSFCPDTSRLAFLTGYNIKVDETDRVNIHAEHILGRKLEATGFKHVDLLAIVAPPLFDDASGQACETSQPCRGCRHDIRESDMLD